MSHNRRRRALCLTTVVAALLAACVAEDDMAQHLPIDPRTYLNQRWQDQFTDNVGSLGVPPFKQLVRIELPVQYTRTWAINLAPVTTDAGGLWETGANLFPIANGELELRWGTGGYNETVNFDYPQMGGTVLVNASFLQLGGRSSVADPLVPARYTAWATEAGERAHDQGRFTPSMDDSTTNLGPSANSTKFRPRRASSFLFYAHMAGIAPQNVRVQQRSASGGTLDTITIGPGSTVGGPAYLEKYVIPLHRQCDRLVIFNDDAALALSFTVTWLLDLG